MNPTRRVRPLPNHVESKDVDEPPLPARSLKRKKPSSHVSVSGPTSSSGLNGGRPNSERVENKVPVTLKDTVSFAATRRPPSLERDLLVRMPSKKDKGKTEQSSKHSDDTRSFRLHNDESDSNVPVDRRMFTGPLAVAEYERMKKEIEALKESLHESKKLSKRQAKQLEESKAEANAAVLAKKDREIELADVKAKCRKNEQLISTIESSVQCQICMDLPDKPFALNPCGHVLCLSCLQQWFRKAPPSLDDMDADPEDLTDPQYILMRSKTCPSCRAVVKHRPVPVFMIKSVVMVLKKTKSPHASPPRSQHNNDDEDNPWKGIFASSEEEEEEGEEEVYDDESPLESDSDDLGDWYQHSHVEQFEAAVEDNAATESDDEDDVYHDANLYTLPRWAPPSVSVPDYSDWDDDGLDTTKLLQRGCTWDMLQRFDVSYSHESGIVVALRSLQHLHDIHEDADDADKHRVFLGWNIDLAPDDLDGEVFLYEILREIEEFPERWQLSRTPGFPYRRDARRLVLVDEAEEFDITDTEAWIDSD